MKLVLLVAIIAALGSFAAAQGASCGSGECQSGWQCCSNSREKCAPYWAACCSDGSWCSDGKTSCCPPTTHLSAGRVLSIVAAGLFVVGMISLFCYCARRRRQRYMMSGVDDSPVNDQVDQISILSQQRECSGKIQFQSPAASLGDSKHRALD